MSSGRVSRLRVALRLARRQVRRAPGASLLVAALVAMPVAVLAASATFWQSQQPTPEQRVALQLGDAQSWLSPGAGVSDMRQYVDEPNRLYTLSGSSGSGTASGTAASSSVAAAIPAGVRTLPVSEYASAVVETPTGRARVETVIGEVWDPLLEGRYLSLDGRAPTSGREAMVTPGLLHRLGAAIGGDVVLPAVGERFTISGLLRRADRSPDDDVLFLPATAAGPLGAESSVWYAADWQPDLAELDRLNQRGIIAYSRDLVLDPPPGARLTSTDGASGAFWNIATVIAAAVVFGGYLTVLLAGAALSVSSRRQQRTLAVAASVGAGRADLFRVILLQGTVLGLGGGIAGAAAGVGAAAAFLALTDRGVAGAILGGNWGFRVPWLLLAAVLAFAVIAGTISAVAPARAASRGDTIGALRGARRPSRVDARRPVWGVILLLTGLATTAAGGAGIAALDAAIRAAGTTTETDTALRIVALWAVVLGPVVLQVGVVLAGHWLLSQCSRLLARWGLAPRLASRDAAAHPSRVVPAFAAIAACVFLASFAVSATAITSAGNARTYMSTAPLGTVSVSMWAADGETLRHLAASAHELVDPTSPQTTALVQQPAPARYDPRTGVPLDPEFPAFRIARADEGAGCGTGCAAAGSLSIVDPDEVATFLGTTPDEHAMGMLRGGGAIVLDPRFLAADGTARVTRWHEGDLAAPDSSDAARPRETFALPAVVVPLPQRMVQTVVISPDTARGLGVDPVPNTLVASYAHPLSQEVVDRLRADAEATSPGSGGSGLGVWVERGPSSSDPWLWLLTAVAAVLVVGVSAVCLGLARFERRPDDATLAAVGGQPRLRRGVNAWQALVIVGIGSVTGAAAGALPMLGIAAGSNGSLSGADTPVLWLAGLAVVLPAGIAAVAWIVPPRRPDLTRRTVIA